MVKRTYKRNSNKHNITKRKLLKGGYGVPIEYTKKDIEQKIKEYITEKTTETDETDPIHYLNKIIPFMDKRRITGDEKIAYLKLLIRKFLENNENIPNNMYKETIYTISDKKDTNFKTEYFISNKELLCYILRTCLYYYSYSQFKKDKKTIFLRTLVSDILRFFFTSQKVDFDKYKVVEVVGKLDIEDSELDIEDSEFNMEEIFENVKIYKNFITANFTNAKLDHYVNSILYSNSNETLSEIIKYMSYAKFKYIVGAKDGTNIINLKDFNKIKNTYEDEYDEHIKNLDKKNAKSNVEWTPLSEYFKGKGRYKGF
jgi:hypothetical protein